MVLIMSGKKVFLVAASLVLMSLFSGAVFAQGEGLGGVAETIRELFGFIPKILTLEALVGGDAAALFWAKFLIWLLLFAVIYFGASKVFAENKRIAVIVALAISLMGALLIPNNTVVNIFQTYGLAAGFAVWFVPVIAGLFLAHKIENRAIKTVFYLVLILLLINIDRSLTSPGSWLEGNNWIDYFRLLFAVVIIAFIWNLFSMWGGGGVSDAVSDRFGDVGRSFEDWIGGGGPRGDRRDRGRRRREREEEEHEEEEDAAEIRAEHAALNTLDGMRKEVSAVKVDNSKETNTGHIERAMEGYGRLEAELRDIYALERKEIGLEQLSERQRAQLGIKRNNAVAKLIGREVNYINHLRQLVQGIGDDLNVRRTVGRTWSSRPALTKIREAMETVKLLIRINSREIGEIRREERDEGGTPPRR